MSERAELTVTDNDGSVTILAGGALDITNCQELGDALKQAAATADSVVVDLRPSVFIDTQVIQDLAHAAVKMRDRGKRLKVIASAAGHPYRVLLITGLQSLVDIEAG